MVTCTQIVEQTASTVRRMLSKDPLRRPLGRVPDSMIDAALAPRKLSRAELFSRGKNLASHRHRLIEMLTVFHFSPQEITALHWPELRPHLRSLRR